MQFVVKVGNSARDRGWIAAVGSNGLRALGPREQAEIFTSRDEAGAALAMLSPHFGASGIRFSVEPVDADAQMACVE